MGRSRSRSRGKEGKRDKDSERTPLLAHVHLPRFEAEVNVEPEIEPEANDSDESTPEPTRTKAANWLFSHAIGLSTVVLLTSIIIALCVFAGSAYPLSLLQKRADTMQCCRSTSVDLVYA
jgi:hypothetical protein